MNAVTFHVPGKPQGKARAKTVRNKHTGNTMSYTPETDLLYENYIKDRFLNKCNGNVPGTGQAGNSSNCGEISSAEEYQ